MLVVMADNRLPIVASMTSYLVANGRPIYLDELVAFMRQVTGDATLSEEGAVAAFQDPQLSNEQSQKLTAEERDRLNALAAR